MDVRTPTSLSSSEIGDRLRARFGDDIASVEDQFGHAVVSVSAERYQDVARFLRDDPDLALDFFDFTAGVDLRSGDDGGEHVPSPEGAEDAVAEAPPAGRGFQVLTHLASTRHGHHVRLKVAVPAEDPVCPTLSEIYPGANWHERETWELFGIRFEGHPHLVKLLLPEPFEGHPLRKDFELMSRVAKPWPGVPEGEEVDDE